MKKPINTRGSLHTFIISLIFAIAIWVAVGITNNPDIRNTVTSLPIHYTGLSELNDRGLVIIAPNEKNTAAVTVVGKRSDLIKYSDELYISADVSDITAPGEYSIKGTAQLTNSRISIVRERIGDITIVAQRREEKEIDVEIRQTGSTKNTLIKALPQPKKILVSGAKSEIAELEKAVITIDVSEIHESTTIYSDFKLCDASSNPLTKASTLSPHILSIPVELTVYEKKSLPIELRLSENLRDKYIIDNEETGMDKDFVEVGVLGENKSERVYVEINDPTAKEAELTLIEENGMYIPKDIATIKVKPHLIPIKSAHMDITVHAENLGDGLSADFSDTLSGVLIYAPEEMLSSENFRFIINLEGLKKGKHKVKVEATDSKVKIAEEIFVEVVIQ